MKNRLLPLVFSSKLTIAFIFILAVISVVTSLLGPYFISASVDCIDPALNPVTDYGGLYKNLAFIGISYVANAASLWFLNVLSNKTAYNVSLSLRNRMFDKLRRLPLSFYDRTPHGNTLSRFTSDADALANGLVQCFSVLISGIITIIGAVIIMLKIDIFMALVVIFSAPLAYFVARFVTLRTKSYFKEQVELAGELNGYSEEMISNKRILNAFSSYDSAVLRYKEKNAMLYKAGVNALFFSSLANPSTRLVNNISYAVVGILGCFAILNGSDTVSVGVLSGFLIYANIFAKPFNEITGVITNFQEALACSDRIFTLLESDEISDESLIKAAPAEFAGEVEFKNVSFSYSADKPLIKNFNLKVSPGMRCAIVGGTGAGKTTLVNLLMRFYDVNDGDILIDNQSIYSMTRDSLRSNFGMVLQDSVLFEGTIAQNIAYGNPDADPEAIKNAAKRSGAHSFIRRLELGYDTPVSESAKNLSEGQKQLLAITRVMLFNPEILILDEATSSVDTVTETHIQRAFDEITKNKTSFIIAHRLSTIRDADIILVMQNGNVVESGKHDELLRKNGIYHSLYHAQFDDSQI
ncbi:MAG: ABC transporter ATP-binding protein [Ruminococcaceae bacterium]|nr:ABC transporter ATP-binding protein [Oscillospiraceae bacterium]